MATVEYTLSQRLRRPLPIDFDVDILINPEVPNFLRDFTSEWTAHSSMCSPGWKLDEIIMHVTSRLLFNFDFPSYYEYPSGVYRDELQVCFMHCDTHEFYSSSLRRLSVVGSTTAYLLCVEPNPEVTSSLVFNATEVLSSNSGFRLRPTHMLCTWPSCPLHHLRPSI
jgi:hypothetical protein